jgi:adenylate cyclase
VSIITADSPESKAPRKRSGDTAGTTPLHGTWSKCAVASWLADHRGRSLPAGELLSELCARLAEEGIPMMRVNLALRDYHPQIAARTFTWRREDALAGRSVEEVARYLANREEQGYLESPVRVIYEGAEGLRRHLCRDDSQLDFPILRELKEEGATDYVAMSLVFADGTRHFLSWATDQPGGFTSGQLSRLYDLMPLIGLRIELDHARLATRTLLTTYLGQDAAQRVLAGHIRRGEMEEIEAVLLFADLRGFTRLVETSPPEEVIRILSIYYEAVAEPVRRHGGDIVKMIGDGILALFPISSRTQGADTSAACGAAAAVREGLASLAVLDDEHMPNGHGLHAGFALHAGRVAFGNVGSLDRLDYTVIGPAVNEVTRVEALTKTLNLPVLVTASYAALNCPVELVSMGFHALRGVRQPKELFTLADLETVRPGMPPRGKD